MGRPGAAAIGGALERERLTQILGTEAFDFFEVSRSFEQKYRTAIETMEARYAEAQPISRQEAVRDWFKMQLRYQVGLPSRPIEEPKKQSIREWFTMQAKYGLGISAETYYVKKVPFMPITYAAVKPPTILDIQLAPTRRLIEIPAIRKVPVAMEPVKQIGQYYERPAPVPKVIDLYRGPVIEKDIRSYDAETRRIQKGIENFEKQLGQLDLFPRQVPTEPAPTKEQWAKFANTVAIAIAKRPKPTTVRGISKLPEEGIGKPYREVFYERRIPVFGIKYAAKEGVEPYRGRKPETKYMVVERPSPIPPKRRAEEVAEKLPVHTYDLLGGPPPGMREVVYKPAPKGQLAFDFVQEFPRQRTFVPITPTVPRKAVILQPTLFPTRPYKGRGMRVSQADFIKAQQDKEFARLHRIPQVGEKLKFGQHRIPRETVSELARRQDADVREKMAAAAISTQATAVWRKKQVRDLAKLSVLYTAMARNKANEARRRSREAYETLDYQSATRVSKEAQMEAARAQRAASTFSGFSRATARETAKSFAQQRGFARKRKRQLRTELSREARHKQYLNIQTSRVLAQRGRRKRSEAVEKRRQEQLKTFADEFGEPF